MERTLIGRAIGVTALALSASTLWAAVPARATTAWHGYPTEIPGANYNSVAVGANGDVWAIGGPSGSGIFHWSSSAQTWLQVPGSGRRIAVDASGTPYVVNDQHQLFEWNQVAFRQITNAPPAVDLAVDNASSGDIWLLGADSAGSAGNHIYESQNDGSTWQQVPGAAKYIAVGGPDPTISGHRGRAWVVNASGQIFSFNGITSRFSQHTGSATPILNTVLAAGSDGTVCVIGSDYAFYCLDSTGNFAPYPATIPHTAGPFLIAVQSASAMYQVMQTSQTTDGLFTDA